jgi:hypothetical protein
MPCNPRKRLCQHIKADGTPCLSYAQRTSPYCRAHNPDLPRRYSHGAGPHNRNAFKHGYYATFLTAEDLMAIATMNPSPDLADEIALVRFTLRRLASHLDDDLTLAEMVALARVLVRSAARVARLLDTQRQVFGDSSASAVSHTIEQALAGLDQPRGIDQ